MGDEEIQYWRYLDAQGQQQGPITADELQALAGSGVIHRETQVWTDGLAQWVPATQIEGLIPAEHHPQFVTGTVSPQAAAHPVDLASQASPTHPHPAAAQAPAGGEIPVEEGHYPPTPTKGASFGKIVGFLVLGLVMVVGGPLAAAMLGADAAADGGELPMAALALGLLGYLGGTVLLILGQVCALIALYRGWDVLKWGEPRTTPGKAVGFLFIPLFNLYWMFVAYYGLAKDWNRVMGSFEDLLSAPKISAGTALAACICMVSGIGAPIGLVLLLVHYSQICAGVNFMAGRAMRQTRASGIHLY